MTSADGKKQRSELQATEFFNPVSLSEKLWGLSWGSLLPFALDDAVTLRTATTSELEIFVARHFESIYGRPTSPEWLALKPHPSRSSFYQAVADSFVLEAEGRVVGILLCHATDWSSYYLRNISILKEYQGRKLYQKIVDKLSFELARVEVERLEVEVAALNQRALRVLSNKGFICTGSSISERWGQLNRYTLFLKTLHAETFARRFFVQSNFGTEPGSIRKGEL